jgi:putative endonuclease
MGGWVYLLANRYRGTIYIGVTSDLAGRTGQHQEFGTGFVDRFDELIGL